MSTARAAVDSLPMVEVRPHYDRLRFRGYREVFVGGEWWATIEMQGLGGRGSVYRFRDAVGTSVRDENGDVRVYSDKIAIWPSLDRQETLDLIETAARDWCALNPGWAVRRVIHSIELVPPPAKEPAP